MTMNPTQPPPGAPPAKPGTAEMLAAIAADLALAVACYLASYRLRFDAAEFGRFLPTAFRALPLAAVCQVAALGLTGTYGYREGRRWLPRLVAGIAIGTAAGAALAFAAYGFQGISRASFVIDPVLLLIGAFGWRGLVGLWRLARYAREAERAGEGMVDRAAAEASSVSAGLLGVVRHRELVRNLVMKDLKLKYRGSVFGFLWSLVNPLMMLAVYSVAFTYILRIRVEGFVFLLLVGLLAWTFFSNSAGMSTGSVVESGGLVKSVFFPRAVLPIATVLFNFSQYLLTILVFLPLMLLIYGVPPAAPMLLYPVFLALQLLCTIGTAFILATATAFYRDVRHIVEIGLSVLFWTTPIVYVFGQLPEAARLPVLLSPMSSFVVAYQEMFFYGRWPDLSLWLAAIIYGVGTFVVGAVVFATYEHRFAEQM
jgi:lipopolysaccharide transport system permease protein